MKKDDEWRPKYIAGDGPVEFILEFMYLDQEIDSERHKGFIQKSIIDILTTPWKSCLIVRRGTGGTGWEWADLVPA